MKKRNFVFGLVGLELLCLPLSLPAAAQMMDRIKFEAPARVVHSEFPHEPGRTRMFVVSNAPFHITSKDMIGTLDVNISISGRFGSQSYGQNAQAPGALETCAQSDTAFENIIYKANQKTAASRGGPVSQAVLVEITYDPDLNPEFNVVPAGETSGLQTAITCQTNMS